MGKVNIVEVNPVKSWIVQTEGLDYNTYRRSGVSSNWEVLMGESWEPVWQDADLESAFQKYWSDYTDSWGQSTTDRK